MSKVKITDKRAVNSFGIPGANIPDGQYFTGSIGDFDHCVFVRCSARLIPLDNPGSWFDTEAAIVDDYQAVDVEIVVTDPKE